MLGKLMKYEVRSCGRIFFPFYIVVLIFSIVASLFINFDNYEHDFSVLYLVGFLAIFALFVAAIVLTILLIVQRFNKSLLEDEGYLMFTLPVSQKSLVLSKFLTSLLFIILTSIVGMICISLVLVMFGYKVSDDGVLIEKVYEKKRLPIRDISRKFEITEKILKRSKVFILSTAVLFFKKYTNLIVWIKGVK